MNTKTKYLIVGLSVVSAAGLGYFIYSKVKIANLNKKVSTLSEADSSINAIDTSGIVIPTDVSNEPDVPLYSGTDDLIDSTVIPDNTGIYTPYTPANPSYNPYSSYGTAGYGAYSSTTSNYGY